MTAIGEKNRTMALSLPQSKSIIPGEVHLLTALCNNVTPTSKRDSIEPKGHQVLETINLIGQRKNEFRPGGASNATEHAFGFFCITFVRNGTATAVVL